MTNIASKMVTFTREDHNSKGWNWSSSARLDQTSAKVRCSSISLTKSGSLRSLRAGGAGHGDIPVDDQFAKLRLNLSACPARPESAQNLGDGRIKLLPLPSRIL
jgi:hypothetical protein